MLNRVNIIDDTLSSYKDCKIINNYLHILYLNNSETYICYTVVNLNNYTTYKHIKFYDINSANFVNDNIYMNSMMYSEVYKYDINNDEYLKFYDIDEIDKFYFYKDYYPLYFYAFEYNNDLYFLTHDDYEIMLTNITKNTRKIIKEICFISIYNNNKLFMVDKEKLFYYDLTNDKIIIINQNSNYVYLGYNKILINKNISDFEMHNFNIYDLNTLSINNDAKKMLTNYGKFIKKALIVDNNSYLLPNYLYIYTKNTIEKFSGNNYITLNNHKIPKDVLIRRCEFFKNMDELFELNNEINCEYNNEYFSNINIYIDFITNGITSKLSDDIPENDENKKSIISEKKNYHKSTSLILKLFDICLYLGDIDTEYVANYIIEYASVKYYDIRNKKKKYLDSNMNEYLYKLYDSPYSKQFHILLNNHLSDIKFNEYRELINTCDKKLYPHILKFF